MNYKAFDLDEYDREVIYDDNGIYVSVEDAERMQQEIETLRSRIKQLSTESDRLETGVRDE